MIVNGFAIDCKIIKLHDTAIEANRIMSAAPSRLDAQLRGVGI